MIFEHHKVRRYAGDALVELFRRADLVDLSFGLVVFKGVSRAEFRALQRAFPTARFHARLVALAARQFLTDPLDPLPMLRW